MRSINIEFSVSGYIRQNISIHPSIKLSDDEILEGLRTGTIATSIQEGGVLIESSTRKIIGVVEDVENGLEYDDFECVEE